MNLRLTRIVLVIVLAFCWAKPGFAQFEDLIKIIPSSANAIAFVNVKKVYNSPHAVKQNWLNNARIRYAKSPLYFPAAADVMVLAAEFDLVDSRTLWEASLIQMGPTIDFEKVKDLSGGQVDLIAGKRAIENPDGSIIILISDHILGSVFPGNRQYIHRWANSVNAGQAGQLTPYLRKASEYASSEGADTEIIVAIDLGGVVQENRLRSRLAASKAMEESKESIDICVDCLTGIQGVTLGIRIGEKPSGSVRVDFDHDAGALATVGKPLFLELLDTFGANVDDFHDWQPRVQGNTFFLQGNVTDPGLRQIASIIEPPPMRLAEDSKSRYEGTEYSTMSAAAAATKEHFDAVQVMLRELRGHRSDTRGGQAAYYERFARKVDRLPVLDVDDQMLDYSASIADRMREVAGVSRGTAVGTAAIDKQYGPGITRGGGYVGYYGTYSPRQYNAGSARRAASAAIVAQGAMSRSSLQQAIDSETRDIRRAMSEKYGIEF